MSDYIICYDIACPRRLGRVHRYLKKRALPLQYSVFLLVGTDLALQACLDHLRQLIDSRSDDVRAYPLPQRGLRVCMGRATLPEGVHWGALPAPWNKTENPDTFTKPTPETQCEPTPTTRITKDDGEGPCFIV